MPIPDEEFLAVSIDAKIDYHQTVDLGKAKMSFKFISFYLLIRNYVVSALCAVLFIMLCISLTGFSVFTCIESAYERPIKWPIRPELIPVSVKRLGILLLPPGWDASLPQGYPQH